jgi:hypothetical protein
MLRDNLVDLIEPMPHSAGPVPLALGIFPHRPASDDRLSCLENPRLEEAESSLTENLTSPFQAEPAQVTLRFVGYLSSTGARNCERRTRFILPSSTTFSR